jgi:hypothetical protein
MSRFDKRVEQLEDDACINKKVVVLHCHHDGSDEVQAAIMQQHIAGHPEDKGAELYVFIRNFSR